MMFAVKRAMVGLFAMLTVLCSGGGEVRANDQISSDEAAMRLVIRQQLQAFRDGASDRAYGFASPMIRHIFPTAEMFVTMVKRGYPQIYRSQDAQFEKMKMIGERPFLPVTVYGRDGTAVKALYEMLRLPDGSWRINGVSAHRLPGAGT